MSEWWDPVKVKKKKREHLALPLYGKGGCLFSLIGVLLIIGGCSQMEDGGGYVKGWETWSPIVFIGLILFFFGAIAQAIIEVVKPFTARNQGEGNPTKKTPTSGNQWDWNANEEPLTELNKGKENSTKSAFLSGIGCWFFLIGVCLTFGSCSVMFGISNNGNYKAHAGSTVDILWRLGVMLGFLLCFLGPVIQLSIWLGKKLGKAKNNNP
jgi:hypothetical protein